MPTERQQVKSEQEIREQIAKLQADMPEKCCKCGCNADTIDWYEARIKALKWVLGEVESP